MSAPGTFRRDRLELRILYLRSESPPGNGLQPTLLRCALRRAGLPSADPKGVTETCFPVPRVGIPISRLVGMAAVPDREGGDFLIFRLDQGWGAAQYEYQEFNPILLL